MNKFEKLIEYIINDEDQKARELFHDIVVEKSRDIYESIMDEESMEENFDHPAVAGDQVEDMVKEVGTEEAMGEDDEEGAELELGGDEEEFGDEEDHDEIEGNPAEEEIEDKVMNIDAKLDELLAKFDEIMGDEGHGEEPAMHNEPEMGAEHGEEPEMAEEMYEEEVEEEEEKEEESKEAKKTEESKSNRIKSTSELMREYVDQIGDIYGGQGDAAEGTAVGAAGKKTSINTKDPVGPGADFGGTPVRTKGADSNQDGTSPTKASNEYTKGEGTIKSGNVNVPGGKAAQKPTGKEYSKSHDAEGKTVGNNGSVPINKKSEIGGKVR